MKTQNNYPEWDERRAWQAYVTMAVIFFFIALMSAFS